MKKYNLSFSGSEIDNKLKNVDDKVDFETLDLLIDTLKDEIVEDVKTSLEEPVNYTNVLKTALASDGTSIYNGKGYKKNTRWSSTSNSEVESTGTYLTGFISVKEGAIIRLKNITLQNTDTNKSVLYFYNDDISGGPAGAHNNTNMTKYNAAVWDVEGNLSQVTINGYKYIRFQCAYIDEKSIITVNEEIPEDSIDVQLDNIEETLRGQNERLTILETSNTDDLSIPSYYKSHADEKIDKIRELMEKAGRNKSSFLFYSDAHWDNASKVCPSLLNYITKYTAINKTIFGGDIVNVEPTTETLSDRSIMKYLWDWRNQIRNLRHYSVIGNHDDGNGNTATGGPTNSIFDLDYVYSFLFAPEENNAGIVRDADTYYYFDDSREKTRYLCLDTSYDLTLSTNQANFIKESLKSTPENWHIIVVAHIWYGPDYDAYYNQGVRPIPIAGLSSTAASITTILDNYNARKDVFTDCKAKVEFCIGGHVHIDYVNKTTGGIPIILCETASSNLRSGGTCSMTDTTQTAVSGIIADYEDNIVNVVRVGRGNSFKIDLTTGEQTDQEENIPDTPTQEPETTTYTNVLDTAGYETGYRLNSSATTSVRTDRCVTGFIPAKFGDTVYFKNIEMLKDDYGCTVGFYNSNKEKINCYLCSAESSSCDWLDENTLKSFKLYANAEIAYVRFCFVKITDDSIITINQPLDLSDNGIPSSSYTNLFVAEEATSGYRINSSGVLTTSETDLTTGYIKVEPNTEYLIRVNNKTNNTAGETIGRLAEYSTKDESSHINQYRPTQTDLYYWENDGHVFCYPFTTTATTQYIRLNILDAANTYNIIITLNEPIV